MDSESSRHPLQDALVALASLYCVANELRELLIHLVDGRVAASAKTTVWREEYDLWEAATAE